MKLVKELSQRHESLKIVVSEVTPRQIRRDDEVRICNDIINQELGDMTNITIAHHSNLRVNDWKFHIEGDDKHLARTSIAKFASNLKVAFRLATGLGGTNQEQNKTTRNRKTRNTTQHNTAKKNEEEKSTLEKLKAGLLPIINEL